MPDVRESRPAEDLQSGTALPRPTSEPAAHPAAIAEAEAIAAEAAAEVAAEAAATAQAAVVVAEAAARRATTRAQQVAARAAGVADAAADHAQALDHGVASDVSDRDQARRVATAKATAGAVAQIAVAVEAAAALVASAAADAVTLIQEQLTADALETALDLDRDRAERDPVTQALSAGVAGRVAPGEPGPWRDISLVLRMKAALQESEAFFEAAFRAAPVAMCIMSPAGSGAVSLLHVNPALARLTGYPLLRLLDRDLTDLEAPDQRGSDVSGQGLNQQGELVRRWVHADGHVILVRLVNLGAGESLLPVAPATSAALAVLLEGEPGVVAR